MIAGGGHGVRRRPRPLTPAATVIVLRDGDAGPEVLLVRRAEHGGAFGGMWVFPGGKVEPVDADPVGADAEIAAARHAAVREAREEAGVVLEAADLVAHSYWVPPPDVPRRFSTWFFVVGVDAGLAVAVDGVEVDEHRWLTAAEAMVARDAGALPLAPPTWMTLWELRGHGSVADVLAASRARPPARFETRAVEGPAVESTVVEGRAVDSRAVDTRAGAGSGPTLVWPGDAAYDDGDLGRPGPRRRLRLGADGPWCPEISALGAGERR